MHRTIESAADHLRHGAVTAEALLDESLAAIDAHGERTNAFIVVDAAGARAAAHAADAERARGVDRGPLHGIPISIKDLIDIAGFPTTAASKIRAGHLATDDAPVIRLLRSSGAVIIGKTNLHEFALGPTNEDSAYGPVRNPVDVSRISGGSSGGSAAAVATGMGLASIGSDTGGSIRIPAAACGVVGLKPSYGEVSVDGAVPLSKSLDTVGPITRSVADAAILWCVLTDRPPHVIGAIDTRAVTIGVLGDYFTALLDDQVRTAFENAIESLRDAGVKIETRTIGNADAIMQTYVNISLSEAAHWHAATLGTNAADYLPSVRARLETGSTTTAVDYLRAQDARTEYRRAVTRALEHCDAIALPTLPIVPPPMGTVNADIPGNAKDAPLTVRAAMLRLTQLFNITGHPAISIPVRTSGLPVGLQLVGGRDRTEGLLRVALACEHVVA
jgi:aspartyl-tRNA(Asn)/glutamyl-tRNA(Gln) amidotransferase subunit A